MRNSAKSLVISVLGCASLIPAARAERPDVVWTRAGHSAMVLSVDLTSAADRLVTASHDQTVKIWDFASGQMLYSLRGFGPVALAPDDSRLAVQTAGVIELRRLSDGALLTTVGGGNFVRCAWSPDAQSIAAADFGNSIRISNTASGATEQMLNGHSALVRCVAYAPDGSFVVSGAGYQGSDNTARIWSTSSGQQLHVLTGHTDYIGSAAVSPDSAIVATGSGDHTVKLWQSSSGTLLRTLSGAEWPVWDLAFSPDGQKLAAIAIGGPMRIWRVSDGAELLTVQLPSGGRCARYSADGQTLVVGTQTGAIEVRSAADGSLLRTVGADRSELDGVSFSADGRALGYGHIALRATRVRARDGLLLDEHTLPGALNDSGVVFSPDLSMSATVYGLDAGVQLFNLDTAALGPALNGHVSVIFADTFSPDGALFATAGEYQAGLWHADTGEFIQWFQNAVNAHHSAVAFSADGAKIALVDATRAKVFDVATAEMLHDFPTGVFGFTAIAFSPDGGMLVVGGYDQVWAWDLSDETLLWNDLEASGSDTGLCFTRDGRYIFSGGRDGIVQIRRAGDGVVLRSFAEETGVWVTSVALSPTDRTFVYTRTDATVVVARNPLWTVGDVDGDGCVTLSDLTQLLSDFGRNDEPAMTDLNDDGATDLADLAMLLGHFGSCD
jgi:WD40 repeat protein